MTIFTRKIILIGNQFVGKTSLRKRYMGQGFSKTHLATMGADFAAKDVSLGDDIVKLQIWDIAGQDSFKIMRSRFYSRTSGVIAVFDLTDMTSFDQIFNWIEEFWEIVNSTMFPIVLVGNKKDLEDERQIQTSTASERINKFINENGLDNKTIHFVETSALTGENVEEAFLQLIENMKEVANLT